MPLIVKENKIPNCYELLPEIRGDARGAFIKTFHEALFKKYHFATNFVEEYYSVSHKGVLRGMHFQTPPHEHTKVVYCVYGEVMDVLVDLRVGSREYGKFEVFSLNAQQGNMLYIPPGVAHGFYVVSDTAILLYKVTSVYSPVHDTGILWNSIGIPWLNENPLISERDAGFKRLEDFDSPFQYEVTKCE